MANAVDSQVIVDGVLVTVLKLIGTLDSSDEAYVIKVDPATLADVSNDGNHTKAGTIRIRRIQGKVEDGLTVSLFWDVDGTQPNAKRIEDLEGRFDQQYLDYGSLKNNAANGGTGKIGLSTEGWAAGAKLSYALTLELVKYP